MPFILAFPLLVLQKKKIYNFFSFSPFQTDKLWSPRLRPLRSCDLRMYHIPMLLQSKYFKREDQLHFYKFEYHFPNDHPCQVWLYLGQRRRLKSMYNIPTTDKKMQNYDDNVHDPSCRVK